MITRSKALMDNIKDSLSEESESVERSFLAAEGVENEPSTFEEAFYEPNLDKRQQWQLAINKEIKSMEKCGVWSLIDKKSVPNHRRLIGNRWVFKEKRDGVFRARLMALGYSQIPGIDFTGNYSPVVDDWSFRIILLLIVKLGLKAWSIDFETAFLNGNLDEEIYMKIPKGYDGEGEPKIGENKVLKLHKSIYGLVQAARQWHKRFDEEIIKLGFKKNEIDPCVFFKQEGNKICILCIYVDNGILAGNLGMMESTLDGLGKVFKMKVQPDIKDFLGCEICEGVDEIVLSQKRIVSKLVKSNKIEVGEKYKTPSEPGFFVVRPAEKEKVSDTIQKWYRSNIGSLLYLVKLSRPDLANPVRELSKVMDGAAPGHVKELKRLIQFIGDTRNRGLKMKHTREEVWELEGYSNSNYAGDRVSRDTSFLSQECQFCGNRRVKPM
jgi:Reverse transcriptase (RNA-dependent DNA polymerase)